MIVAEQVVDLLQRFASFGYFALVHLSTFDGRLQTVCACARCAHSHTCWKACCAASDTVVLCARNDARSSVGARRSEPAICTRTHLWITNTIKYLRRLNRTVERVVLTGAVFHLSSE
jgi:hypothetical protein